MMFKKLFLILAFSIINLNASEEPTSKKPQIALHYFSDGRPVMLCGFIESDLNSENLDKKEDLGHNCFVVTIIDPSKQLLTRRIVYGCGAPTREILVTPNPAMISDKAEHAKVKSIEKNWREEQKKALFS